MILHSSTFSTRLWNITPIWTSQDYLHTAYS